MAAAAERGVGVRQLAAQDGVVALTTAGAALLTALDYRRRIGALMLPSGIAATWWSQDQENRNKSHGANKILNGHKSQKWPTMKRVEVQDHEGTRTFFGNFENTCQ